MKLVPEPCECGRTAVAHITQKYPASPKVKKFVCGYHLRSYMTSEYKRHMLPVKKAKRQQGYGEAML